MMTNNPVPALIEDLKSSDRLVREVAVETLGKLRDPHALEPLLVLARDYRWEVQGAVAQALGLIGDIRALDMLFQMYEGKTYQLISSDGAPHRFSAIVGNAAIGLGRLYKQYGNPEIFETLTSHYHSEINSFDDTSIACTVQGLPYTGDHRVTPLLLQAASIYSPWLRYRTLEALGVLADPEGFPILYRAVREGDPFTLVKAAADALALIRHPDAEQPLLDGLRRLEAKALSKDHLWCEARARIARALGIIGTSGARLLLEQRFNGMDAHQRALGAIGLAYMGDKHVLQRLVEGLSIGDWWTQAEAATALGVLGDPASIPALIGRLPGTDSAGTNVGHAIRAVLVKLRQP